jgi:predicted pyridoxine 5'-phosphate oxidase superfamily flavin-nucleotide-binding protein
MATLTPDMRRVIEEQRLGYVATVCTDDTPNLSPKGTVAVWDDTHLAFADICSPQTVANLYANPAIKINVVDPFARRGYRFKGTATVVAEGQALDDAVAFFRSRGARSPIRSVVMVAVERALPLASPVYATGVSEAEVRERWEAHYRSLMRNTAASPVGSTVNQTCAPNRHDSADGPDFGD